MEQSTPTLWSGLWFAEALDADMSSATAGGVPAANLAQFFKKRRRRASSDKFEAVTSAAIGSKPFGSKPLGSKSVGSKSVVSFRPIQLGLNL